jgi:tRNA modification GTPase
MIRISGSDSVAIASRLIGRTIGKGQDRQAIRARISDAEGRMLDDGLLIPFFAPRSFTGEDSVELHLHGSSIGMDRVLEAIFSLGARLALPGEFSFRAVRNGKLTLSQAEAVRDLVSAENDFALELALEKLSGSQHALLTGIRTDLIQLCTLSEVGIDFSDQDIDEVSLPALKKRLQPIEQALSELSGSFERGKRLSDGVPVTIFGLPNAGKSSYFNALLGEDRSIVSPVAGTTRDVVRERLNLRGKSRQVTLRLSDTAGLRRSEDRIEEIGIERTLRSAVESDLLVVVIDGAEPALEEVGSVLSKIDLGHKSVFWVFTKSDLLTEGERERLTLEVRKRFEAEGCWISSKSHAGIAESAARIAALAEERVTRGKGEVVLTRVEHRHAVEGAIGCLGRAQDASDLVLFATDVRHAIHALEPLIGETLPDDILGKIFSDFCIGK